LNRKRPKGSVKKKVPPSVSIHDAIKLYLHYYLYNIGFEAMHAQFGPAHTTLREVIEGVEIAMTDFWKDHIKPLTYRERR